MFRRRQQLVLAIDFGERKNSCVDGDEVFFLHIRGYDDVIKGTDNHRA